MPKARKHQIALEATPYYHCTSRCVRRAFLCGFDALSGKSYEHRRDWIEERIHRLAALYCIEVCAYAVMSNHLHVVLHINQQKAEELSLLEVSHRWHQLFKGTPLTQRFARGDLLSPAEYDAVVNKLETWRQQLYSISWFMRSLNEPIARQANAEDKCTGSFWESRFTCQALLDDKALAACLAYVDLNPIRAKMADTPEQSDYTSVKSRITSATRDNTQPTTLFPFVGNPREPMPTGLPFELNDYLSLVDWTGRILRHDKRGAIDDALPNILQRLHFTPDEWKTLSRKFESKVSLLVGHPESVKRHAEAFGYRRTPSAPLASPVTT